MPQVTAGRTSVLLRHQIDREWPYIPHLFILIERLIIKMYINHVSILLILLSISIQCPINYIVQSQGSCEKSYAPLVVNCCRQKRHSMNRVTIFSALVYTYRETNYKNIYQSCFYIAYSIGHKYIVSYKLYSILLGIMGRRGFIAQPGVRLAEQHG